MLESPEFYSPEPMLLLVGQGYYPSDERVVDLLLEEMGIRVAV